MDIRETRDETEIKKIILDDSVFYRVTDDTCRDFKYFEIPEDYQFIGGYVGGEIIGLMVYHLKNKKLMCHFMVLAEYRNKYAKELARMALNFGRAKNASIYAEIPTLFKETIFFAKSVGFKLVDTIDKARKINGKLYDLKVLRRENGR